jgi:hypothetical protein
MWQRILFRNIKFRNFVKIVEFLKNFLRRRKKNWDSEKYFRKRNFFIEIIVKIIKEK